MAGQVIGLNTAIITGSRGYEGVGFALPSNTAINVYNQIIKYGKVTRGSIGVRFTEENGTNPIVLKELGASYGIVIEDVEPGGPAARAGLKPGDVIITVNGNPVHKGNDLVNPIAQTPVGEKVRIGYVRDRKQNEVALTVEDRVKVFPDRASRNGEQPGESAPVEFGLRVEGLTPERAQRLGVEGQKGIVVTEVEPASFADDIGFARGDIVVEINHDAINSMGDYRRAISKLRAGQNVVFKVMRRGDTDRLLTVFLAGIVPGEQR
jgi:serine protease Do